MGLKIAFEKTLRKKFIADLCSEDNKAVFFERIVIPLLSKISGVEGFETWVKTFDNKNIAKQEDLQAMFKHLGLSVKLHWNVAPNKQNIFVFNHPTGLLEGLFMQQVVQYFNLRGKVLADETLFAINVTKDITIPLSIRSENDGSQFGQLRNLKREIKSGQSLIICPSANVSKKDFFENKIVEYEWNIGFLELSKSNSLDIIPCYIDAELTLLFYMFRYIYKDASSLILFKECTSFLKRNNGNIIDIYIGDSISHETVDISEDTANKFRELCQSLKFKTYNNNIIKP